MKASKTIKMSFFWVAGAVVFGALFLTSFEARAENWIQVDDDYWYNSEYTFIDRESGFVVVETADDNMDGSFFYGLNAIDCDRWYIYGLAERDENGGYGIYNLWRTDQRTSGYIPNGTNADKVARIICPNYYNFPYDNIF